MTSAYAAEPVFEPLTKTISNLIQRIHDRELALPDFQRSFVWDAKATVELLRSIMSRFPVGVLLFWKQTPETTIFAARHFEEAPELSGHSPDELVLDGQQRLTALYRALLGASDEKYYVAVNEFLHADGRVKELNEVDFEAAIRYFDLTSKLPYDPEDIEVQLDLGLFPVAGRFEMWIDKYARTRATTSDPEESIKERMWKVYDCFLLPLRSYGFPVIRLPASTPLEAVCNIFETLNRTGKALGAFDLVTARLFPQGVRLRDLWEEARENYSIIGTDEFDIESYPVLQAVCLRARNSAQRADVLKLIDAKDIENNWADVVSGFAGVLNFLRNGHGVANKRWLPYGMILVSMAAVWPEIKALRPIERGAAENRLGQFFWCSTFMATYDQGANSQAGADYTKLRKWLFDEQADPPAAVAKFALAESTLRDATVRRKAFHAGVMALTIKMGAKDLYSGETMNAARIKERKIDSHHLFPKGYLNDIRISELILNRALIDSETNRIIGKKAPSEYLMEMAKAHDEEKINDVLESHAIDPRSGAALREDNYELFLSERLGAIIELIEGVTKKSVTRDIER